MAKAMEKAEELVRRMPSAQVPGHETRAERHATPRDGIKTALPIHASDRGPQQNRKISRKRERLCRKTKPQLGQQ